MPSGSAEAQQAAMLRATSISGEPKRVRNAEGVMEAWAGAVAESVLVHHSGGESEAPEPEPP